MQLEILSNLGKIGVSTLPSERTGHNFSPRHRIAYVSIIRNRHSETVDRALVSRNSVLRPKFHPGACVLVHRLSCLLGQTWIFVRLGVEAAREAPIPNRHFDLIGDKTLFLGRKTFISRSKITILANDLPDFKVFWQKRLPRLRESLAEPTHGASLPRRSDVVLNSARDLLPSDHNSKSTLRDGRQGAGFAEFRSGAEISPRSVCTSTPIVVPLWSDADICSPGDRRYSHPLQFIPTPSAKELGITFRPGIRIAYVSIIRNRHFETVDRALVSWNSISGPKFRPGACVLIFVHPRVKIARKAPIRNRHFDPVGKRSHSEISGLAPKFLSGSVVAGYLLPRSLIWVLEHRRYGHPLQFIPTPSAKELGITFRPRIGIAYKRLPRLRELLAEPTHGVELPQRSEVMFNSARDLLPRSLIWPKFRPGACALVHRLSCPLGRTQIFVRPGVETAREAPIQNRHFDPKRLPRLRELLAKPTHGASLPRQSEVVFNSARDLLPRSLILVLEHRRYSHPLQFIPTPSAKKLGITFRPGIRIAYVAIIRNRHSETVDRGIVSRNSVPGPKFRPGACVLVHRLSCPFGQTRIFVRPGVETAREALIWN
ncbi:hypothetical protein Taro_056253 [Colocasia esculenta]|uniref:Uncharacterized protein n=1 Tax=Colocasia esculenta TaxID=4460 RepID=A0A843XW23_COLES|nr:hypothetical protein [Colocasia esculenta]